jgi:hypothetical protein
MGFSFSSLLFCPRWRFVPSCADAIGNRIPCSDCCGIPQKGWRGFFWTLGVLDGDILVPIYRTIYFTCDALVYFTGLEASNPVTHTSIPLQHLIVRGPSLGPLAEAGEWLGNLDRGVVSPGLRIPESGFSNPLAARTAIPGDPPDTGMPKMSRREYQKHQACFHRRSMARGLLRQGRMYSSR